MAVGCIARGLGWREGRRVATFPPTMLITLTANAFKARLISGKKGRAPADGMAVTDLPRFARDSLGLHGLNLSTNLLVGADLRRLDAIRDAADKASCPCLVLAESETQPLATEDDAAGDAAIDRCQRVVQAAHRLGCNSMSVTMSGSDSETGFDFAVERLKRVLSVAERLEVNILISSGTGLTSDPERLTDLIKKVGGFRIGTFPDFLTASESADPALYLKRLTPYAAAVTATVVRFKARKTGEPVHEPYDLPGYARVVQSVGYTGTISIDYRGAGDPAEDIRQARVVLESAVAGTDVSELIADDDEE